MCIGIWGKSRVPTRISKCLAKIYRGKPRPYNDLKIFLSIIIVKYFHMTNRDIYTKLESPVVHVKTTYILYICIGCLFSCVKSYKGRVIEANACLGRHASCMGVLRVVARSCMGKMKNITIILIVLVFLFRIYTH